MRKAVVLTSAITLAIVGYACFTGGSQPDNHAGSPAFTALLSEAIARLEGITQEMAATTVGEAQAANKQPTMYGEPTCDRDQTECWELTYDAGSPTCEAGMATCDATETCSRFYTCDSQYTCHGEATCNGTLTCWNSTCDEPEMTCDETPTCDAACIPYTMQGNYTCDGTPTCHNTCMGWPGCGAETMFPSATCDRDDPNCWELTYDAGSPTCEASMATCDDTETCSRFYTCDSQYTCHGEVTCNGTLTCWNSTCDEPDMTCDGVSPTCTGAPDCSPYTMQGNYTCDGSATCHNTCAGWPDCGPTSSGRTTWGSLKKGFTE
ncbi:MAG: hypothetical protein KAW17_13450 [Candidatus Eisenbacteria sp.]|nr:hypothetical protein [Candidatus Eisenbacteria bacterium]